MKTIFATVFLIFGTVVGSGFSSGKEIMVFFSRFGKISYLYILLAGVLFYFLFYFFLTKGKFVLDKIKKNKWIKLFVFFISLVFCGSMFAGIQSLLSYLPNVFCLLFLIFLLILTYFVTLKGLKGLEKINYFLMPIVFVCFLAVLIFSACQKGEYSFFTHSWAGVLYSPLYVALNTSISGIVISSAGQNLTKRQAFFSSFFSSLLIFLFLTFGNFVLQRNSECLVSELPFLQIVSKCTPFFFLEFFVVLSGCFTTLISLTWTLKNSFANFSSSETFCTSFSVFVPFLFSLVGFSKIVSNIYPICSVLGIFVLLFSIFPFKQTDAKIHDKR